MNRGQRSLAPPSIHKEGLSLQAPNEVVELLQVPRNLKPDADDTG